MTQKQFDKSILETKDFKRKSAISNLLSRFTESKTIFVTSDYIGSFENFSQFYRIVYHEYDKHIKKKRTKRVFPLVDESGMSILDTANGAEINLKVLDIYDYEESENTKKYTDALIMKFTFSQIDENNQYTGLFDEGESVIIKFKVEKHDEHRPATVKDSKSITLNPITMVELVEAIKIEKVYKTQEEIENNDNLIEYNEHNLSLLK